MPHVIEAVRLSLTPDVVTTVSTQFFAEWTYHGLRASRLSGVRLRTFKEADSFLTAYGKRCFSIGRDTHQHISALGEVGCFLAHRKAWQYSVDSDVGLIVCEDGVVDYHREDIARLLPLLAGMAFVSLHQTSVQSNHIESEVDISIEVGTGLSIHPIRSTQFSTKCYYLSPAFAHHLLSQSKTFDLQVDAFVFLEASYLQVRHTTSCKYGYTSHSLLTGNSVGQCRHNKFNGHGGGISLTTMGYIIICGSVVILLLSILLHRCRNRSYT
jgi:GR25 family glycosyltransferase involved in LPS biosynthesis